MNFKLDISQAGPTAGVATLTFDFPGERINKLDSVALLELQEQIRNLAKNTAVKLLVFRSAKRDIFIAGADINEIKDLLNEEQAYKEIRAGQLIIDDISKLPFPTLAVINGVCLGGGCELALACTYRIATDNIKAIIGLPEVSLGIMPGFGGTVRLPKLIGLQAALQLILSAKPVHPKKALQLKLVDQLYNNELEESSVADFIERLVNDKSFAQGLIKRRSISAKKFSQRILEDNILGQKLIFKKAKDNLLKKTKGQYPAPIKALETIEKTLNIKTTEALEVEARAVSELAVSLISKNLI
ncbi:MAG: 3-hydroxyacyl-CoA dehydrogenase/enoyl-CoA hydratase/3-hydroxybutyryl-CoA epimerase, partial [Psychromonas sp.]